MNSAHRETLGELLVGGGGLVRRRFAGGGGRRPLTLEPPRCCLGHDESLEELEYAIPIVIERSAASVQCRVTYCLPAVRSQN